MVLKHRRAKQILLWEMVGNRPWMMKKKNPEKWNEALNQIGNKKALEILEEVEKIWKNVLGRLT